MVFGFTVVRSFFAVSLESKQFPRLSVMFQQKDDNYPGILARLAV